MPRSAELTLVGARGTGHTASEPEAADGSVAVGASPAAVELAARGVHEAAASTKDTHAHMYGTVRLSEAECVWSSGVTVCTEYANLPYRAAAFAPVDP